MKYIRQFLIIIAVSFAGEVCHALLPFPVPASIYGLVLMLACLLWGVIPLASVREAGTLMVEIMPLLFIPAAVGLLESWGVLQPVFVQVAAITVISTILVIAVSAGVTQFVIRRGGGADE